MPDSLCSAPAPSDHVASGEYERHRPETTVLYQWRFLARNAVCARAVTHGAWHRAPPTSWITFIPQDVPLRQWVLTLPFELRARLAFDRELLGGVSKVFVETVLGFYQRTGDVSAALSQSHERGEEPLPLLLGGIWFGSGRRRP